MLDAAREVRGKLIRVLIVEPNDHALMSVASIWDEMKKRLIEAEEQRKPYGLIEMPKALTWYGIPVVMYVKPKKNLVAIRMER